MEMISKTKHNGVWYYDWNDIHAELTKVYPCATEILMEQYEGKLTEWMDGDHHFISRKTILPFLRWVGERGSLDASSLMYQIEKCIKRIWNKYGKCRASTDGTWHGHKIIMQTLQHPAASQSLRHRSHRGIESRGHRYRR